LNHGSSPTNYAQSGGFGDTVTLDDNATGPTAINLTQTLTPVAIFVNNNGWEYSFAGAGKISGVGTLTKDGFQPLTVATANDYTGGTILNAGNHYVGTDQALGAGTVTLNLGTLASASAAAHTLANEVRLNADTGIILGDAVNPGALNLAGAVDLGGSLTRTLNFNSDVVLAGTLTGRPASSPAIRPTLRFSSPAPLAFPKMISSICVGSR
jgi:autotransporter-associated beta strand protein